MTSPGWSAIVTTDARALELRLDGRPWLTAVRFGTDDNAWPELDEVRYELVGETVVAVRAGAQAALLTLLAGEDGRGPLALDVRDADGGPAPGAWLTAQVAAGPAPLHVRLAAGEEDVDTLEAGADLQLRAYGRDFEAEVLQMTSGAAVSSLNDAVYDRDRDAALRVRGADVRFRTDATEIGFHARRELSDGPLARVRVDTGVLGRRLPFYAPLDTRRWPSAPSGWCSFYAYGNDIDSQQIVRTARALARDFGDWGLDYCLIDGGWQARGVYGSWSEHNERFPEGMAWLADAIRAAGLRPALWFLAFGTSDETLFEQHPDWFLRDAEGDARLGLWIGDYLADLSHPELREHLAQLYRRVTAEWGYEYLKLDGLAQVRDAWRVHRERAFDPALWPDEAFRDALRAIRDAANAERDVLIAGCRKDAVAMGLVETARAGVDTVDPEDGEEPSFRGVRTVLEGMRESYFAHGIAWHLDPDAMAAREPLSLADARTWASAMALSGQVLMLADDPDTLSDERREIVRKALPVAPVAAMDLFPLERDRSLWALHVARPFGGWTVLGAFNFGCDDREVSFADSERSGLHAVIESNDRLLGEEHGMGDRWGFAADAALAEAENARLASLEDPPAGLRTLPVSRYLSPPPARTVAVDFAQVGLDPERAHLLFDFWDQRFLGRVVAGCEWSLAPHACMVVRATPDPGRPCVVGTDRHVTMGAVELIDESWDETRGALSFTVAVVRDAPLQATVFAAGRDPVGAEADGGRVALIRDGDALRVGVESDATREVVITIRF